MSTNCLGLGPDILGPCECLLEPRYSTRPVSGTLLMNVAQHSTSSRRHDGNMMNCPQPSALSAWHLHFLSESISYCGITTHLRRT